MAERIEWLRAAAGQRFEQLELNLNLMAVAGRVPRYIASQLGLTAEALAGLNGVTALTGTADDMCSTLLRRRETLGISYLMVSDELMEELAPVVERLTGQ
jgi:hypothetical protein